MPIRVHISAEMIEVVKAEVEQSGEAFEIVLARKVADAINSDKQAAAELKRCKANT